MDAKHAALAAGYSPKTARLQARELLGREKYLKALDDVIAEKASTLEICPAFVVKKYLELINWASGCEGGIELKDPPILLRALDGLCKHLSRGDLSEAVAEESMLTRIIGLNQEKI